MGITHMQILYFVVAICLFVQLFLLYLQWRAYRATSHRSLVWLMTGSALALIFYAGEAARYVFVASSPLRWTIYLLLLPVMFVSIAAGVCGTALLLRAFTAMVVRERGMVLSVREDQARSL